MEGTKIAIITFFSLSLLGAGSDLWMRQQQKDAKVEQERALSALSQICVAQADVGVLENEKVNDQYAKDRKEGRMNEFFDSCARSNEVKMTRGPSVSQPIDDSQRNKGYIDTSFELNWGKGGARSTDRYQRDQIAAFCYVVENHSPLLKVSYIKIEADPKNRDDLWVPSIVVTERRPSATEE
jgi:hypothetical protein